jgi:hypothetical protein
MLTPHSISQNPINSEVLPVLPILAALGLKDFFFFFTS